MHKSISNGRILTPAAIILLIAFTIGAAFVQRTTGFGFGIFIMTMLPYLLPSYGEATTLSGMLAMLTSLVLAIKYRKLISWRNLAPILITFLIVSSGAVLLLGVLSNAVLHKILGITLILAAIYFWFFSGKISIKPNLPTQASLGTLSGIMGGLFGMQGPPAVLYFLSVSRTKEEYAAIAQTYFLIGNIAMTIYRAHSGFLTSSVLTSWCYALPAVFIGTWLGGLAFKRLSLPLLKKIVYAYIALSGVLALCS
ncbi:MAG: sulfite exporter TauE/SafE family protein [Prevotellaceae bacterium]|nr:sulfite exporter TauE/SafE family protein [Candidatus Minthosoma caballi]